jgi:hypothetical protein
VSFCRLPPWHSVYSRNPHAAVRSYSSTKDYIRQRDKVRSVTKPPIIGWFNSLLQGKIRDFPSAEVAMARSPRDTMNISNEPPVAKGCTLLRQEALKETYSLLHGWIDWVQLSAGNLCKREGESGEDGGAWRVMGNCFRRQSPRLLLMRNS